MTALCIWSKLICCGRASNAGRLR